MGVERRSHNVSPFLSRFEVDYESTVAHGKHLFCFHEYIITPIADFLKFFLSAVGEVTEIPLARALVDDYRTAIAEGKLEDAKRFAEKALAADPACFVK